MKTRFVYEQRRIPERIPAPLVTKEQYPLGTTFESQNPHIVQEQIRKQLLVRAVQENRVTADLIREVYMHKSRDSAAYKETLARIA